MLDLVLIAVWPGLLRAVGRLRRALRPALRRPHDLRLRLAAAVTVGLLVYLTYALVRPERF